MKDPEFEDLRILIVEDDVLLAMELEDFLRDLGCEVVGPFARLDKGMEAAEREELDGAILDLNLRGELSFPLIDRLREQNVPVVLCSGYADLPGMKERLNGTPSLAKPYSFDSLRALLRSNIVAQGMNGGETDSAQAYQAVRSTSRTGRGRLA